MKPFERFLEDDLIGVRFALNVFIGTTLVWVLLKLISDTNPIWAIASMIAASDPQLKQALRTFWSRITNALVGCAVGLFVLVVGGWSPWKLPLALAITVLISTYVVRVQVMWRQAPITAAIVIAGGLSHESKLTGVEHGVHKVAEVIFGCVMGLLVSLAMSKVWPIHPRPEPTPASPIRTPRARRPSHSR
jgi:uncharacterized membrane protein YgaE (UPF0421/DUF939 family)